MLPRAQRTDYRLRGDRDDVANLLAKRGVLEAEPRGRLRYAGTVSFGLGAEDQAAMRTAVAAAQIGSAGRGGVVALLPQVSVVVDAHGRRDPPLRDPVLRAVLLDVAQVRAATEIVERTDRLPIT